MNRFGLSEIEMEAWEILAWEDPNYNEIADCLGVKPQSVSNIFRRIFAKMHVHNNIQAVLVYHGKLSYRLPEEQL